MKYLQWAPFVLVAPTFAFILYFMWRSRKLADSSLRPRTNLSTAEEEEKLRLGTEFNTASRKLRWLNIGLFVAFLVLAIVANNLSNR